MLKYNYTLFLLLFLIISCQEIINEENISNDTIQLLAPTNDAILATKQKISFNWEFLSGATNYQLQIATPNFAAANQIVLDTLIGGNDFAVDSLAAKSYEWRVKGFNSAFETAYTSNAFSVE